MKHKLKYFKTSIYLLSYLPSDDQRLRAGGRGFNVGGRSFRHFFFRRQVDGPARVGGAHRIDCHHPEGVLGGGREGVQLGPARIARG